MKHLIAFLLCFCGLAQAQTTIPPVWQSVSELFLSTEPPRQYIGPLFSNSASGAGPAANTWQLVTLSAPPWNVAADAKWALLRGQLLITGGVQAEIADLGVVFRSPGDTRVQCNTPNFTGQTVQVITYAGGSVVSGGQRTNLTTWVPLLNGQVEWCWTRSTWGAYPTNSAYGVNLSIEGWAR